MKKVIAKEIMVTVESPKGSIWRQALNVKNGNVKKALADYRKMLGRGYLLCDYYVSRSEEVEVDNPGHKPEPKYEQMTLDECMKEEKWKH